MSLRDELRAISDPEIWTKRILAEINGEPTTYSGHPVNWFGQEDLIAQVDPFLEHDKPFPHTLLLGEPGLGKTHLARYVAFRRNELFEELLAPANPEGITPYGIVLIDEVHRQTKPEPLFKIMAGSNPTIFAATTRPEVVDKAFRSRFFLELHFKPYTPESMRDLIAAEYSAPDDTLDILSTAAAGNPRQAKRLAEVARRLDTTDPMKILSACQITADGLTDRHIDYLKTLELLDRPTGLAQLTSLLYADDTTVRMLERLLIEHDLMDLKPNGRVLTKQGKRYLEELSK